MKAMKKAAALLTALLLAAGSAQAAGNLSLNGTVEAGVTRPVYAPIGGTVDSVSVEQGMRVKAGETLLTYRTDKIYASQDGTVAGVFVQPGDDAETITNRYGADLYLEGPVKYTISASTGRAYSAVDTTFIHTGETVYLVCRSAAARKGIGTVTAVDGSSYTVQVTEGSFIAGDSVNIYRDAGYTEKQKLGRGSITRFSPEAVNGTGAVVNVAVQDGAQVQRGDLLMETLTGTYDGYEMPGTDVTAEEGGIVTSVSAEPGAVVAKGDIVARIAPISGMQVAVSVSADDRKDLKAGDKVTIELESDDTKKYDGTVRFVSEVPEEESEGVTYRAVIDFTPDENVVFGLAVVVTKNAEADGTDAGEEE